MTDNQVTDARTIYAERIAEIDGVPGEQRVAAIVAALAGHYEVSSAVMRAALDLPPA